MTHHLLSRIAEAIFEQIAADRALLRTLDGTGNLGFETSKGMEGTDGGGRAGCDVDETIVRRVLEMGRPVLAMDLASEPLFADLELDGNGHPWSVLSYPWAFNGRPAGVAYLARDGAGRPFTRENMEFLTLALAPALFLLRANGSRGPEDMTSVPDEAPGGCPFLGTAQSVRQVRAMIGKVRDTDAPIFISGESGTGKELAARIIHETGRRRAGPFVAINCAAIPETLLESELFGHARGAFTGAVRDKAGLIEEASKGTFFLDEVGDLPLALQSKLLRVLEEKTIRRVGETRHRAVDVRFVSATNKDLDHEVERGRFRRDLYYRLKIIAIDLPPLRERPDDALLLLNHFLDEFSRSMGRPRPFL